MATNHGTNTEDRPQAALLDDSDFLRTLVERMLQGQSACDLNGGDESHRH